MKVYKKDGKFFGKEPYQWTDEEILAINNRVRGGQELKIDKWANGSSWAFAISFDVDNETSTLRHGGLSVSSLSEGEFGARVAMPKILQILKRYNVPASFYTPAVIGMLNPEIIHNIIAGGHELGVHGWIHERNSDLSYDVERDLTLRSIDYLAKMAGSRPTGIRCPSWDYSDSSLDIAIEAGLNYDSSLMGDYSCYEIIQSNKPTGMVEVPVQWIRDDAIYFQMDRIRGIARPYMDPQAFHQLLVKELELAYEENCIFQLTLHPHVIGHRSRIWIIEDLIERANSFAQKPWFATHEQIATYVRQQYNIGASK